MLFAPLSPRRLRIGFGAFVMVIALAAAPVPARGQAQAQAQAQADDNNPAIEKITELNKKALDAYNDLEFEESRKLLKQALDLCTSAGLDSHPVAARTHVHMGVVLIAAKQQDLGIKQFKRALEIQPDIQVTKALANPEILEAFKAAGADLTPPAGQTQPQSQPDQGAAVAPADAGGQAPGAGAGEPPKPAGPDAPAGVKGIQHNASGRGTRGKPISIAATIGPDVTGYTKVLLEYRPEGAPEYLEREMKKSGDQYVAEIPADATEGNIVSYYIEADNDDEDADSIAMSGSEDRPYNVSLIGEGPDGAASGGGGCEGDDCEGGEVGPPIFVGVMGGVGFGYTTGNGEINDHNKVNAGFAQAAAAQIVPEVGYFITPNFRLSLQVRYQIVSGTTPLNLDKYLTPQYLAMYPGDINKCGSDHLCSTRTTSAIAALARGTWLFGAGLFRPYFSLAVGAGQIRHLVKFSSSLGKVCGAKGDQTCVDTVLSGPVFAGPGAGILLAIAPKFGIIVDVTSVLGFPKFTYNFDVSGGVAARF